MIPSQIKILAKRAIGVTVGSKGLIHLIACYEGWTVALENKEICSHGSLFSFIK